jgi:hypothetical protein
VVEPLPDSPPSRVFLDPGQVVALLDAAREIDRENRPMEA